MHYRPSQPAFVSISMASLRFLNPSQYPHTPHHKMSPKHLSHSLNPEVSLQGRCCQHQLSPQQSLLPPPTLLHNHCTATADSPGLACVGLFCGRKIIHFMESLCYCHQNGNRVYSVTGDFWHRHSSVVMM